MGYESRLYIVRKTFFSKEDNKHYGEVIAMFDMCKFYELSDVLCRQPETDCYIYSDDGNTKILEDCYGDKLREASVLKVIITLRKAIKNGVEYWRIYPLLAALEEIYKEQQKGMLGGDIVVLHFGY